MELAMWLIAGGTVLLTAVLAVWAYLYGKGAL